MKLSLGRVVHGNLRIIKIFLPFQPPAHRAYAPEGRKVKTLMLLRGNRHFKSWEKQGYRTPNQAMQTVNGFIRIQIIPGPDLAYKGLVIKPKPTRRVPPVACSRQVAPGQACQSCREKRTFSQPY